MNLGIFMREGMDLACDSGRTKEQTTFSGDTSFSNFDDRGSKVVETTLNATGKITGPLLVRAKDGAKTFVVLVNKNHDSDLVTTITLPAAATSYNTYTLAESAGKRLYDSSLAATGAVLKINVPVLGNVGCCPAKD